MHVPQKDVELFHELVLREEIPSSPALRDVDLRAELIMEEAVETAEAATGRVIRWEYADEGVLRHPDFAKAIDGLCDLLYVVYGSAVRWGIDLEPFFREVHAANMAKLNGPRRSDGKQLKPEGWREPDIQGILDDLIRDPV